ncbi:MAG: AI-2E family transporter [Gaiellaceae bacterium]
MPGRAQKTEIPRWFLLLGVPLILLLVWTVGGAIGHVIFIFVVAALVALLLNPMVRALGRVRIPRGIAVAIVYLSFAAALGLGIVALATVGVERARTAANRVDTYFTQTNGHGQTASERDINRFQAWLNKHHLKRVHVRKQLQQFVHDLNIKHVTTKVIGWIEGATLGVLQLLFDAVLVIVISIYMLLDMGRFSRAVDRRWPSPEGSQPLLARLELALAGYVKGQVLLSLIIGTSAGIGLWLLGTLGAFPGGDHYALLFGAWVAFTELIPYLGPWLGAVPPLVYALIVHPVSFVWVALLFLGIHQIEGHVVVPNVMGSALRLHPLLVIFGLLVGAEIYGLPGVLIVLPLLAALRATWEFFSERITLQAGGLGSPVPITVGSALEQELRREQAEVSREQAEIRIEQEEIRRQQVELVAERERLRVREAPTQTIEPGNGEHPDGTSAGPE